MLSLDGNRSKDEGTITITTYMSFLSVLYKFAFTFYNLSFLLTLYISCPLTHIDKEEVG